MVRQRPHSFYMPERPMGSGESVLDCLDKGSRMRGRVKNNRSPTAGREKRIVHLPKSKVILRDFGYIKALPWGDNRYCSKYSKLSLARVPTFLQSSLPLHYEVALDLRRPQVNGPGRLEPKSYLKKRVLARFMDISSDKWEHTILRWLIEVHESSRAGKR